MLKMNVSQIPFTRRNSYMAISRLEADYRKLGNEAGLYLRSVHGSALTPLVARIIMTAEGAEAEYAYEWEHMALVFTAGEKRIEICFADPDTILIRGTGGAGLCLDFLTDRGPYDYVYPVSREEKRCYIANCYKNNCRYAVWAQEGELLLEQEWEESSALYARLHIDGEQDFLVLLCEIETEWHKGYRQYQFEQVRSAVEQEFLAFKETMPEVSEEYGDVLFIGAYLNWSSLVRADGFLKRDAMFMSKNWMCSVWSWDHCFNAIALSYKNPELAWDQFMLMFDSQDASGRLPDSVNDAHVVWNYCKPPIHGWALSKMREHMELSRGQKEEIYGCLGRWTGWWLNYRMDEKWGLCVYDHGNDSGWDNSTAFSVLPPVITPELQADLILQMEVLAELAGETGREEEQQEWMQRSEAMLQAFLKYCFRDNLPVVFQSSTGKTVENDSLLPYEMLILGERLPVEIVDSALEVLKSDRFYTRYGFATESPKSRRYQPDGYWRGPVWAPSTLLLLDGLARCGEDTLVREASEKFARMTAKSGFAENFDALTGEGLRDRAYTWTASVFMILAHEYLMDKKR